MKYEPGSIQNEIDGYKGIIKKQSLELQAQGKAYQFLLEKIPKLKEQISKQSRLSDAFRKADPKTYYRCVQETFDDINKDKIPDEYKI